MLEHTLSMLQIIDGAVLAEPVRQLQRDTTFRILDWTVQPLIHKKIIETTGGLFLFTGTGSGSKETKPWAIVLMILNRPTDHAQDPCHGAYWKREMLAFPAGMLKALPPAIRAPRCYGTLEREENAWIWMEAVRKATGRRWSMDEFHRAAYHAGRFGAPYLGGVPRPEAPWLSAPFFRSVFGDGDWWASFMDPAWSTNAWQSPLVQRAFSNAARLDVLRIWAEKRRFWEALDRLPQVFCHNDFPSAQSHVPDA